MTPLVSAIMPTRNRPEFAEMALASFMAQTYANRELIILDDADAPSFSSSITKLDGIHYLRQARLSIPEKLNQACRMARGDILMRFDDDDWSAPERMADQVWRLVESGKGVTGYHSMLFHVEAADRWLKYVNDRSYALGTSLAFRKSWWADHPFRPGQDNPLVGEDNEFVRDARNASELISVDAGQLMVARAHSSNTSVKNTTKYEYRPVSRNAFPEAFLS